jgi:hypothetical protein
MRDSETSGRFSAGNWTIRPAFPLNKRFARGFVLAAVVCGALAAPGLARAADPLGLGAVSDEVNADVQSALAEADASVPGVAKAAQPAVSQAVATMSSVPAAPSVPAPPAPSTEPSAPPASAPADAGGGLEPLSAGPPAPLGASSASSAPVAPAGPLEDVAAEVRSAIAEALAPVFPAAPGHTAVTPQARTSLLSPLPGGPSSRDASLAPTTSAPMPATVVEATRAAPRGEGSTARSPRGDGGDEAPAGSVVPQRPLPPAPPPQRPDMSSPGQGGGQGPLMPLVLAALAAAFALFGFQRHARLVPLSAFRKPRRVVLEVWQPG